LLLQWSMAASGICKALIDYASDELASTQLSAGMERRDPRATGETLPSPSGTRLRLAEPEASEAWRDVDRQCEHFEIRERIARGGMGVVYAGWDRSLHRRVALKFMADESLPEDRERFLNEARAQARLSSPHVVHVYYVGQTRLHAGDETESCFFAMEWVDGGTLEDVLARGETLEPAQAREHMIDVVEGLADALAAGIVHRDIKPSNLLLDGNGKVRIADFGVARSLGPDHDVQRTLTGRVVGTPLYMAPEQARGERVDHRADMYSLGCAFYHLLSGWPPFDGTTVIEIVKKQLTGKLRPLTDVAPDVPPALARVIERLLEKDPARRYESYDALRADLVASARPRRAAGIPARSAACAVDLALAVATIYWLGWVGALVHLAAITVAHSLLGQTPGKWLMNVQVRCIDGSKLGLARSLARTLTSLWLPLLIGLTFVLTAGSSGLALALSQIRHQDLGAFARLLTGLALGNSLLLALYLAGLVVAFLGKEKRAVHDLLAKTEVVYVLT